MKHFVKGILAWCILALCAQFVSCGIAYAGEGYSLDERKNRAYREGESYRAEVALSQVETQNSAVLAYPTPRVTNFMERKTITEWTKRWDTPNKPCYVYAFVSGNCIGYFVSNGKPASTQSYLIPEEYDLYDVSRSSTHMNKQAMDIDGTYGSNNPGYRMFLASGQAIELSGYNVSVIYSDQPVPSLSSTCLGK